MKTGIIYLVTNTVNGKVYVGQTDRSLRRRWNKHCNDAKNGADWYISRSIRKHGRQSFEVSVLETLPVDELNAAEIKWIEHYDSFANRDKGYNSTAGGGGLRGYSHTDEAKRAIAEGHSGEKHYLFGKEMSDEHRKSISLSLVGRSKSAEHRANISKGQTGLIRSPEFCAKISKAKRGNTNHLGFKHTPEAREKMSRANKGRKQSTATVEKRKATMLERGGNPMKGVTMSAESREKMRLAKLGKKRPPRTPEHIANHRRSRLANAALKRAA